MSQAKKLHILQTSHNLNSKPGYMYDVYLYYNAEYGPGKEYTGHIGRIYKRVDGKYTTNMDSRVFSTKESAANHLAELDDTRTRKHTRERGVWDNKTHPPRTLKSRETTRLRSYLDEKTPKGHDIRYKRVNK